MTTQGKDDTSVQLPNDALKDILQHIIINGEDRKMLDEIIKKELSKIAAIDGNISELPKEQIYQIYKKLSLNEKRQMFNCVLQQTKFNLNQVQSFFQAKYYSDNNSLVTYIRQQIPNIYDQDKYYEKIKFPDDIQNTLTKQQEQQIRNITIQEKLKYEIEQEILRQTSGNKNEQKKDNKAKPMIVNNNPSVELQKQLAIKTIAILPLYNEYKDLIIQMNQNILKNIANNKQQLEQEIKAQSEQQQLKDRQNSGVQ